MAINKIISPKLSIILPVRNEGINIYLMLKILETVLEIPHEILIIYDDKHDSTIPEVNKLNRKNKNIVGVFNKKGKGVINAIKSGIDASRGEYILILAVDDLGPTLAIEDMIYLMDHGCDFISCSRYKHGGRRLGGSITESIISQLGNKMFTLISRSAFSDATTGFKMFRRDTFKEIELESRPIGWAVVFEMAVKAQANGLRLGEVPIISIDRLYGGKSSFRLTPWFREYSRWFIYGLRNINKLNKNNKVRIRTPKATIS